MNDEQRLTEALNALPLQPLPAGLTARIMMQVRPTFAPFRLSFIDVLLALACAVLMVVPFYFIGVPLIETTLPTIDLSQATQRISTGNVWFIFILGLELLLGSAIYMNVMDD